MYFERRNTIKKGVGILHACMEVVVLEGSSECCSALMLTLRRLDNCCSRFCLRSWTPSSSRRRRSSWESNPVFLYLSLWWLLDICKKITKRFSMILRRVHFFGRIGRSTLSKRRRTRVVASNAIGLKLCKSIDAGRMRVSRLRNALLRPHTPRGADFWPRRTPADAANRAVRRPNSVRNYVENASYLGSTGFSDVFG